MNVYEMVIQAAKVFAAKIMTAPIRSTYVLGHRIDTVNDAKRKYISQLRDLSELAVQFKDQKALDLIQCNADNVEMNNDLKAIQGKKID